MPISKIKSSSITADAASTNLNIDAGTLFLDTTNNRVGVGNTAPDVKLQVTETSDVGIAMSNSSSVTSGNRGGLAMFNSSNSTVGLIRFGAVTDNVGTDIQFYTRPAAGSLAQTMTLTSAGNLGLGTTNPQFKFHVRGADATSLFVVGNTTEDTRLEISTYQDDRIVLRANDSSNTARSIAFETGLTERMRIDSAGAVGIGTSSPAASLDVATSSGSAGQINTHIMLTRSTTNGAYLGTERAAATNNVSALIFGVNSAERMRLTDAGNVVIGSLNENVASANQKLLIAGSPEGATLHGIFIHNNSFSAASARIALSPRYSFLYNTSPYIQAVSESTSAGALTFGTTTGGTVSERMRITSAGDVGIGTSSPSYKLHVVDNRADRMAFFYNASTSSSSSGLFIESSSDNGATKAAWQTGATLTLSNGNYLASGIVSKLVLNTANGGYNSGAIIHAEGAGGYTLGQLVFSTGWDSSGNATERMRITNTGTVLIGKTEGGGTTKGIQLEPNGTAIFTTNSNAQDPLCYFVNSNASVTNGFRFISFRAGSGFDQVGTITTNGSSTTAYNTSSDYRLKNTIAPMTDALAKVAQLKPVTYKWNVDGSSSQGFIAHELQAVIPDCVTGEKDALDKDGNPEYQGVDTSFLVATLTAAIQEQQTLITQLTERIAALENK